MGVVASVCQNKDDLPSIEDMVKILRKIGKRKGSGKLNTIADSLANLVEIIGDWARVRQCGYEQEDGAQVCIYVRKDMPPTLEQFLCKCYFKRKMDKHMHAGHDSSLKDLYFFDEGRGFFGREHETGTGSGRINIQTEVITKGRSYGMGFVCCSQSVLKLQSTVIDNAHTFVCMKLNNENEAKFCCRRLGLPEDRYEELMRLEPGECYIISPLCPVAVKIKVPFHDLGDCPSSSEINARMRPSWDALDRATVFSPQKEDAIKYRDFREIIGEKSSGEGQSCEDTAHEEVEQPERKTTSYDEVDVMAETLFLLRSCDAHPDYGVTQHYRELGWSGGKGDRVKNQLLDNNLVEACRLPSPQGGRPKMVLKITSLGRRILDEN